jgi:hypothetical protein
VSQVTHLDAANGVAGPPAAPRRWFAYLVVGLVVALIVSATFVGLTYQPLVTGSAIGADDQLLISDSPAADGPNEIPLYTYRYRASASYHTFFSLRNDGPIQVAISGLDEGRLPALIPRLGPAELLVASTDTGKTFAEWALARPLDQATVAPGEELWLWVRWEIGPCNADGSIPLLAGSGVGPPPTIPLRWSLLGIPRSSDVELGYQILFQLPDTDVTSVCS